MKRLAIAAAVLTSFVGFVWTCLLPGWNTQTTDFPNYYTAARLIRQRAPVRLYYDWTWFQREINFARVENQLGGYIPQTPLTMGPLIPLAGMSQQNAKRCWLVLDLLFLAGTIAMLARLTGFRWYWLWLLTFGAYAPLRSNFELGQYYVLLLLLLTASAYCLLRRGDSASGALAGTIFGLKLYSGPLLLYFLARRRWRAAVAMLAAMLVCVLVAAAVFGWADLAYFATQVLPRSLEGETLHPFHPGNGTFSTLLRRTLVAEPELNPHPLFQAPALFFFLQPFLGLAILLPPLASAAGAWEERDEARPLVWLLIALLLASPNTAAYTFTILLLPVALLLRELPPKRWAWVLVPYLAIGLPAIQNWNEAFPKLWLLLVLFLEAGRGQWRFIRPRFAVAGMLVIAAIAATSAWAHMRGYAAQPGRSMELAIHTPGSLYAGSPLITRGGTYYTGFGAGYYAVHRFHDGRDEFFELAADAYRPAAPDAGAPVYFEMVTGAQSKLAALDPETRRTRVIPLPVTDPREPAVSHDGKTLAFVAQGALFLFEGNAPREIASARPVRDPSFSPDDMEVVFAADSGIYMLDRRSGGIQQLLQRKGHVARPSLAPDSRRLVFATDETGPWQVAVGARDNGRVSIVTGGRCNNFDPAWGSGGEIVFASDCGRGLGLPTLYRLRWHAPGA